MGPINEIILSASRRTDIPAFYLNWFMKRIDAGSFQVVNPYNKVKRTIDVSPDKVHSIVFWSKNFRPFLDSDAGRVLKKAGYNLFFNFTINSESSALEPGIPDLGERLAQLKQICSDFGPQTVAWRFDPICFYKNRDGICENNLSDFPVIALKAGEYGVTRCITSFADDYAKIRKRLNYLKRDGRSPLELIDPVNAEKINVITGMEQLLKEKGIALYTCCEADIFSRLPEGSSIRESSCIPGKYLKELFGGFPEQKRDYGQRAKQGCRCTRSIDIGSYDDHPCYHNCVFCYANPAVDTLVKRMGNEYRRA